MQPHVDKATTLYTYTVVSRFDVFDSLVLMEILADSDATRLYLKSYFQRGRKDNKLFTAWTFL